MSEELKKARKTAAPVADDPETETDIPVKDEAGKHGTDTAPVVTVTVAKKVGDRFVLEWRTLAGRLRRAWSDVLVTSASENELEGKTPYGDDLAVVLHNVAWNRADLAEELHNMGVWHISEINANVVQTMFAGYARLASRDTLQRLSEAKAVTTKEVRQNA